MPPPSRRLLNCVRDMEGNELVNLAPWEVVLNSAIRRNKAFRRPANATDIILDASGCVSSHPRDSRRKSRNPRIFAGAIGSSNTLFRDWKERDKFAKQYDLRAIEMEGSGTAEAVWQFGKQYLIVRGISDYGDNRTKNDLWHNYAALAAAAYTKALLLSLMRITVEVEL